MSGGHWSYIQHRLTDVWEEVEQIIEKSGQPKTEDELKEESWRGIDWYEKYPEDKFHYQFPEEVLEEFKKGVEAIKLAQIYMQRMDWLLSGDDGEESFLRRLKEEINDLNK
jgi:exonuclease VII small subunit